MDLRTWPLSAVATQLLLDLVRTGKPCTMPRIVGQLALKELLLRGGLQVVSFERRRLRTDSLRVAPGSVDPASFPAPLAALARELPQEVDELSELVRSTRQREPEWRFGDRIPPSLFERLRTEALDDLVARGLVERTTRTRWKLLTDVRHAPTAYGRSLAETARDALDRAAAERDGDALPALGVLVLLLHDGVGRALRATDGAVASSMPAASVTGTATVSGGQLPFDLAAALDAAFSGALDGAGDAVAAVGDAIDAAIDVGAASGDSSTGGDGGAE